MKIPHIKNAYENIKKACEQRLQEIYPLGIPEPVKVRYETELAYLQTSQYVDDFEILRCLYNEAKKCSQFLSQRGTTTSSYITYLLTETILNPLSTHYYCPTCGHYELVKTKLFGIDLPSANCPKCNNELLGDGFNLPLESTWGIDGKKLLSFEYNISEEFLPFAKRVLRKLYPDNTIAPYGIHERTPEKNIIGIKQFGFLILPTGCHIEDYPEMMTYMEDGELCLSGNSFDIENNGMHKIYLLPNTYVENIIALQRKTGLYSTEITLQDLKTLYWNDLINTVSLTNAEEYIFQTYKPKTFYDMVCLDSASHNSYSEKNSFPHDNFYCTPKIFDLSEFKKYPCYTREDFFDTLVELGYSRNNAFEISEFIRKGKACSTYPKWIEEFSSMELPGEIRTLAKQYLYLFPRSHSAEYILLFARLAFYAKKDSRAFSQIVYKKRR